MASALRHEESQVAEPMACLVPEPRCDEQDCQRHAEQQSPWAQFARTVGKDTDDGHEQRRRGEVELENEAEQNGNGHDCATARPVEDGEQAPEQEDGEDRGQVLCPDLPAVQHRPWPGREKRRGAESGDGSESWQQHSVGQPNCHGRPDADEGGGNEHAVRDGERNRQEVDEQWRVQCAGTRRESDRRQISIQQPAAHLHRIHLVTLELDKTQLTDPEPGGEDHDAEEGNRLPLPVAMQFHGPDRTGRTRGPPAVCSPPEASRGVPDDMLLSVPREQNRGSAGWRAFPTTVVCCGLVSSRLRRVLSLGPIHEWVGRGRPGQSAIPWNRPRREMVLLLLVAVAALSPIYIVNAQDVSRLCLARAVVHLELAADECLANATDRSEYRGRFFSDKAPGMSMLEAPIAAAVGIPTAVRWPYPLYRNLWPARALSAGLAFILCAFLVGRVTEGLAPGFGGISLVTAALGTLMAPLAIANFDHVPAAALGLGAFLLAWRRSPHLAGLAAGVALLFEYEAALTMVVIGVYTAAQGRRAAFDFLRGLLPGAALLWTYNWMAFGAPWRPSYAFVANEYAAEQARGVFGIHLPRLHSTYDVLLGNSGVLVTSPVVVAAGAGLVVLSRRYRAEALTCASIVVAYVLVNSGYFLPYGGLSPGPRFLVPALPFLALGLGPAFARWPRSTAFLAALSIVPMTAVTLSWAAGSGYRHTIWGELLRLLHEGGSSRFVASLPSNVLSWLGVGDGVAAIVVVGCAIGAFVLACSGALRAPATGG